MPNGINLRENSIFLELQASYAGHLIRSINHIINSQYLISNSPYFLPKDSHFVSLENLVSNQIVILQFIFFFILITCRHDII